jgi:hypothetical protein
MRDAIKWLQAQWIDVRGNVKYALLLALYGGGSTAATWVFSYIQRIRHAPQQDRLGYIILGFLIFCGLILMSLLYRVISQPSTSGTRTAAIPAEDHTPESSKEVDLRGEIEQLYFQSSDRPLAFSYSILLKLRITNYGPQEATILHWEIFSRVGEEQNAGKLMPLPPHLGIERQDYRSLGAEPVSKIEPVTPDFETLAKEPFRRGIPREGWVKFAISTSGFIEPAVNAYLIVYVEDSLGGKHFISRPAQHYKKDGEVVTRRMPLLTPLGSGIVMPKKE